MLEIVFFLYATITLFAVVMTYREQKRTGLRSPLFNVLSFLACVAWPATVAAFAIASQRRELA